MQTAARAVFLFLAIAPHPAAATMSLPGSFEVSEMGAAVYTIPIAVPPGSAGMTPALSLVYNSRGGNGLLGMGLVAHRPARDHALPEDDRAGRRRAVSTTMPMTASASVHWSWRFGLRARDVVSSLSLDSEALVDEPLPGLRCSISEFKAWLLRQADGLRALIEEFSESESVAQAVGNYIAIDFVVARMLAAT
jgi:hypothetical protein